MLTVGSKFCELGPKRALGDRGDTGRREQRRLYHDRPLASLRSRRQGHRQEGVGVKNSLYLLESPTENNVETDLDEESIRWAGLTAAAEILNT